MSIKFNKLPHDNVRDDVHNDDIVDIEDTVKK